MVLMMGLRETPVLWILGSLYNMGYLKPCGHKCSVTSSGREDPLMWRVVLRYMNCVGPWSVSYTLDHPAES
jgi:hypothetical protein